MTDELSIRPKADLAAADPAATRVLSKANALVLGAGLKADAQLRSDRPVITSLSLYPDGQHIVGLERGGTVVIWNLTSGKVVAELNNRYNIESVAPCPAGPCIACCEFNDGLWIADPAAFDVRIWETKGAYAGIAFSPDGHWLIAAGRESISLFSADGDKTWSAPQLVQVWENALENDDFRWVAWAPDSRSFAASSWLDALVVRGEVDKSGALERLVLRGAWSMEGLWFSRDGDLWCATDDGLTRWRARSVDYFDYQDLPGDLPAHLIDSYISEVSIGLERDGLFICAAKFPDEIVDGPGRSFGLQGSVASGRFNRVSLGAAPVSAIAPTPEECCAVVSTKDGRNRLIRFDTGEALELGAPKSSDRWTGVWHDSSAALIGTSSDCYGYGQQIRAFRELDGSLCAELDARPWSSVLAVGYGKIAVAMTQDPVEEMEILDVRSGQTELVIPHVVYNFRRWDIRVTMGAGTVAVTSQNDGWLRMWSTSTGTLISEIEMPNGEDWMPDGEDCSPIVLYKDSVAVVKLADDVAVLQCWTERTGVWQATELRIVSAPPTGWDHWYSKANWQSEGWLALPVAGGVGGVVLLNLAAPDLAARRVRVPGEDDGDFICQAAVSSDGCRLAVVKGVKILVINVASGEVHWSCDTGPYVEMLSFSRSRDDLLWVERVGGQLRYKRQRL